MITLFYGSLYKGDSLLFSFQGSIFDYPGLFFRKVLIFLDLPGILKVHYSDTLKSPKIVLSIEIYNCSL
ncbi:hypothetical protein EO93_07695 [Methanosarcina sp. 1.H.A.2.2]|nr:hypothetical protein EO93_07695 [Methanosarcina sp. 1.H.A.2.2]